MKPQEIEGTSIDLKSKSQDSRLAIYWDDLELVSKRKVAWIYQKHDPQKDVQEGCYGSVHPHPVDITLDAPKISCWMHHNNTSFCGPWSEERSPQSYQRWTGASTKSIQDLKVSTNIHVFQFLSGKAPGTKPKHQATTAQNHGVNHTYACGLHEGRNSFLWGLHNCKNRNTLRNHNQKSNENHPCSYFSNFLKIPHPWPLQWHNNSQDSRLSFWPGRIQ